MTNAEKKAGIELVKVLLDVRNGLQMVTHVDVRTDDDLTFAMEQALGAAEKLTAAVKACWAANREAHALIKPIKPSVPQGVCFNCGTPLKGGERDLCARCNTP